MQAPVPRVSIVLNVRNGAAYLREALDSVLAQSFADWELILWDNASSDGSGEIARAFADPRVRCFRSEEATTLGIARRHALSEARGEWLAFLDHDDVWLPEKLAQQVLLADDPRVAIIYGRAVSFSAAGIERDFDHRHEFLPLPQGDVFLRLFTHSCFIAMSSAMLRRSTVEEVGGIPEWIGVIPDYFLYLEIARKYEARAVQSVVCRYRLHDTSLSRTAARRMHEEALMLLDRWKGEVPASILESRRRIHSTGRGVEEIIVPGSRLQGLRRLATEGSLGFLFSRPFAWCYRAARRHVRRPLWQYDGAAAVWRHALRPTTDAPLLLSVIVVNWKVCDLLRECLRSLQSQMQMPRELWEVIVVDNNSGDGSVEMVASEFPDVRLVANRENLGFGRANNQAFPLSRSRYVLLLNPDTVVLDHAADRMVAAMEADPDIGALGCSLLNTDGSFQRWTGGNPPRMMNVLCHFLLLYRLLPAFVLPPPLYLESKPVKDVEVGWVSGACMLLRRSALGPAIFDERFFIYGEDLELCDRLRLGDWKVVYTPAVRIVHHEGRSLARQSTRVQMNKLRALRVVFAMRNSPTLLPAYDLVVLMGFSMRAAAFTLARLFRPGQGYGERAAASRRFAVEALGTLLRADPN